MGYEPFIAEIAMFAGSFAPRGWAFCDGRLLSIAQNTALFSLLGTTYGGNGTTTFALPDLRGRFPVGAGQGPGLTSRGLGEVGGQESVTLTTPNLPPHTHSVPLTGVNAAGTVGISGAIEADVVGQWKTDSTGDAAPFAAMPPYLSINFIIATEGIYPSRGD